MEQHPVPRNISSFQFHLVGDMTLKQFVYLACGLAMAFLVIKFFPLPGLVKWPVAGVLTFAGVAFAFIPIQERPLDKWLLAFIKSINAPTQYFWQKDSILPDIIARNYAVATRVLPQNHKLAHEDAKRKLEQYLSSMPSAPHQTINTSEKNYVNKTLELFSSTMPSIQSSFNPIQAPSPSVPTATPTGAVKIDIGPVVPNIKSVPIGKTVPRISADIPKKTEPVAERPKTAPITTPAVKPTVIKEAVQVIKQVLPTKPIESKSDAKLDEIIKEKQQLEKELQSLKNEMLQNKKAPIVENRPSQDKPQIVKPQMAEEKKVPTIKTVTPKNAVNEIGIPKLPQTPNLIMGIIKDTQAKHLPNIILTIKDTKGVPQRALKTNKLGQFSTATPLSNGTYLIEAEDPLKRYVFDIAEIILSGKVFLPIEIDAKGEKELMREKLSHEIFGLPGQQKIQGATA